MEIVIHTEHMQPVVVVTAAQSDGFKIYYFPFDKYIMLIITINLILV